MFARRERSSSKKSMEPGEGRGAHIDPINDEQVHCSCYLILDKVMKNYSWGECMLDVISMAKFCKVGEPLNWCKYLLMEMLQACVNVHERATYFIYDLFVGHFCNVEMEGTSGAHTIIQPRP
jgi:hypothetical protein